MVRMIRVDIPRGTLVTDIEPKMMRLLKKAIMAEFGRKGGVKSTRAKQLAALKREARKREARTGK